MNVVVLPIEDADSLIDETETVGYSSNIKDKIKRKSSNEY